MQPIKDIELQCKEPNFQPGTAYSHGCRCQRCIEWRREKGRRWRQRNPDRSKAGRKSWESRNPEKVLITQLKRYGLTLEQYKAFGNVCMICQESPENKSRNDSRTRLCVDHNKLTGKVRGLLCSKCNTALGQLNHSVDLLDRAIAYLNRSEKW